MLTCCCGEESECSCVVDDVVCFRFCGRNPDATSAADTDRSTGGVWLLIGDGDLEEECLADNDGGVGCLSVSDPDSTYALERFCV
jgi:hypothetical protein